MSAKDFEYVSSLGKGSYSSVDKVKRKADNQFYAMKKVSFGKLTDREKENALNEVRLIASIDNPHIISYKEAFFDNYTLCIIMEYAENGDLLKKVEEHKKTKLHFQEEDVWKMFIQVSKGLKALHELNIVHRDLKCANVFLGKSNEAKLGDFNVSKIAKKGMLCTQTGTPYYASPEVWKDKPYNAKSDIWSLGVVTYEMCALHPPFLASSMNDLYKKIMAGTYPPIPSTYSKDLASVIKACLQTKPELRPTSSQIVMMEKNRHNLAETLRVTENGSQNNLLNTIKLEKNMVALQKHLPKASYVRPMSNPKVKNENYTTANPVSVPESKPVLITERKKVAIIPKQEVLTERKAPPKPTEKEAFIRKIVKNIESPKPNVIISAPQSVLNKNYQNHPIPPPKPVAGKYISNPRSQKYLSKRPKPKVSIHAKQNSHASIENDGVPKKNPLIEYYKKHEVVVGNKENYEKVGVSTPAVHEYKKVEIKKEIKHSMIQAGNAPPQRSHSNQRPYSVRPSWWG